MLRLVLKVSVFFTSENDICSLYLFTIFFKEWIDEYKNRYVDAGVMKHEIDDYMKNYDESKEKVN